MIEKVFKEVDTNSNGFLDQAEVPGCKCCSCSSYVVVGVQVEAARGTVSKILAILQDASQRNE